MELIVNRTGPPVLLLTPRQWSPQSPSSILTSCTVSRPRLCKPKADLETVARALLCGIVTVEKVKSSINRLATMLRNLINSGSATSTCWPSWAPIHIDSVSVGLESYQTVRVVIDGISSTTWLMFSALDRFSTWARQPGGT